MYIHYNITKVFMVYWNLKQARNVFFKVGVNQRKVDKVDLCYAKYPQKLLIGNPVFCTSFAETQNEVDPKTAQLFGLTLEKRL